MNPPCVLHEDDDLLVVVKPPGLNTHAPSPHAGEGIFDWLRNREPRWAGLAIIHRLDKETSGLIAFAKTPAACKSLTAQFTARTVRKVYLFRTDRPPRRESWVERSSMVRRGDRYETARPGAREAADAETSFRLLGPAPGGFLLRAEPRTGRTHQIRVHASAGGVPILGDTLYGGGTAPRLLLHAAELTFRHPADTRPVVFRSPAEFEVPPADSLRAAICRREDSDAFRLLHGAGDRWAGWYLDRYGAFLLSQGEGPLGARELETLRGRIGRDGISGAYHKVQSRHPGRYSGATLSPRPVAGTEAPSEIVVRENGVQFSIRFGEGSSVGLFLDQRDNRRRFLVNHVGVGFPVFPQGAAGAELLNVFAYTCGFSVCAALAGARTTSLDLSRHYLEWGRRNFELNRLPTPDHEFILGDAFEWMERWGRKGRQFDAVVLDPPTFSQSKATGVFRAEKDFGRLVSRALPLLRPGGVLLASCNAARWPADAFLKVVRDALAAGRRAVVQEHYVPQPLDFPIARQEPAYLKTAWFRID